ncbi:MAG: hypothetical protein KAQ68_05105 [Clostridiales bacterium]|nr:hypothetical protein [Clostridiales bacterium]
MKNVENCEKYKDSYSSVLGDILKQSLFKNGYVSQIVPIERLKDLQKDIEKLKSSDLFSEVINTISNDFYRFSLPGVPFKINSIIIVASPKPLVRVNFKLKAKTVSLFHHTYVDIGKTTDIKQCLNEILNSKGYHVIGAASLPQKLLAVRSGLAKYGRNNITYVDGMGSLQELTTLYSDIPCTNNSWHEIRQMNLCKTCSACINNCPTAAITEERFLIKAERCLTYLNEFVWPKDFPSWLDKSAHNCIHGCILCQIHCPKNRDFISNIIAPIEFNEDETLYLLEGKPLEELPEDLVLKLRKLNLAHGYFELIPRNLKALFDKKS